ncbi:hypothetical protein [Streptomyces sp. NPDC060002]|uniref:hypothetical protein n=1 Tax=Streptomyces sp. NPDC060002 TaxID=3347033 RepID=UPI0036CD249E
MKIEAIVWSRQVIRRRQWRLSGGAPPMAVFGATDPERLRYLKRAAPLASRLEVTRRR